LGVKRGVKVNTPQFHGARIFPQSTPKNPRGKGGRGGGGGTNFIPSAPLFCRGRKIVWGGRPKERKGGWGGRGTRGGPPVSGGGGGGEQQSRAGRGEPISGAGGLRGKAFCGRGTFFRPTNAKGRRTREIMTARPCGGSWAGGVGDTDGKGPLKGGGGQVPPGGRGGGGGQVGKRCAAGQFSFGWCRGGVGETTMFLFHWGGETRPRLRPVGRGGWGGPRPTNKGGAPRVDS